MFWRYCISITKEIIMTTALLTLLAIVIIIIGICAEFKLRRKRKIIKLR